MTLYISQQLSLGLTINTTSHISEVLKKLAPNPSLVAYVTKQATTYFKTIVFFLFCIRLAELVELGEFN